jgi:hypothetical protein
MGTEAAWVPFVISALSAGAGVVNQQQQAHRQEDISNQMVRSQQSRQHEADAVLNQNLDALSKSNADQARSDSLQGFLGQLRANQANASGGAVVPGAASDRAQAEAASGKAAIQNYGTGRADILSRIMGPTLQRVNEQNMTNRAGDEVRGIGRNAQGDAWLAQLRTAQNVQNPWVNAASQVGQGVASGMAGSGWNPNDPALEVPQINAQRMSYTPPMLRRGAFG